MFVSEATILHADLDAFYASVEQRDDPRLRARPVIVGSGVVLAASYEAKAYGVRTAMSGGQARRLCPQAVVAKPDGLLVVPPDAELDFLHPLPVRRLWGVGPITAEKLGHRGIRTVGEVAGLPENILVAMLGRASGRHLHALALGRDPRPVRTGVRRRSMGAQRALGRRDRSPAELDAIVVGLTDRLSRRLRTAKRVCRTVTLRLRFDDFSRATRSHTLPQATVETPAILDAARGLLPAAQPMIAGRGLTLIGVALANLHDDSAVQPALPFGRAAPGALDGAVDEVRDRFGSSAITRAVLLGRDEGVSVPLLPD
jgi:DNA polymerase-4